MRPNNTDKRQPPPAKPLEQPSRDQQRQRLVDLIGKLLARHWLVERAEKATPAKRSPTCSR